MSLLIHTDTLQTPHNGTYQYLANLLPNLKFDFDTISSQAFSEIPDNHTQHLVPIKPIKFYRTYRQLFVLNQKINQLNPAVFFEPNHLLPLNLNSKIKVALFIHDLSSIKFPDYHIFQNVIAHKLFFKKSIQRADLILTPSDFVKQEIKKYYPKPKNIVVIHHGTTPNPTITPPIQPIPKPYFLYLGTIEPRKNLETLIRAYNQVQTQLPEKLLIIGNPGWHSTRLHQNITNSPNITYLSGLPEAQKNYYLKHATALIYPSHYEGFGLPPLEALNCQTPIITSKIPVFQELYQNCSLQFPPNNPNLLAQQLLEISQNPQLRQQLITKSQKLLKNFTWQNTANQTAQALSSLL